MRGPNQVLTQKRSPSSPGQNGFSRRAIRAPLPDGVCRVEAIGILKAVALEAHPFRRPNGVPSQVNETERARGPGENMS